jgi:Zn-dependent metalloprotease
MSDIFGACIDRRLKASEGDTWKVGEEAQTPYQSGDATRYMNDPRKAGDIDYYADCYRGDDDNGGVHTNSGRKKRERACNETSPRDDI